MRDFFKLKAWIIGFACFLLAILISSGIIFYKFQGDYEIAEAGASHNVSGFAWSDNYGWISFNSTDCDTDGDGVYEGVGESGGPAPAGCPVSGSVNDYGVIIDPATGDFSGYAWSSNVGWIDFAPSSPPSSPYPGPPLSSANYNRVTEDVTGWAKILALGDDGWLKLRKFSSDSGADYGVTISSVTDEFSGWAWNGNNNDAGVGWISFNCLNDSSCASSNYKVIYDTPIPLAPTGLTATALNCTTMSLAWTDNSDNEIGFKGQYSSNGGSSWNDLSGCNTGVDINYCTINMPSSTTYDFRVKALGEGDNDSDWSNIANGATSYCPPVLGDIIDFNCDRVVLAWTQSGTGIDYYEIFRNQTGTDPWGSSIATVIYEFGVNDYSYEDNNIGSGEIYYYKIVAEEEGLSDEIGPINPCPNLPEWKEVK